MLKQLLNVIVLLTAGAVTAPAAVVKGVVADSAGDPLPQATVRLLKANADSTYVTGVTSDNNGLFRFPSVTNGKYIIAADYIGYRRALKNITVSKVDVNADTLRLAESSIMLKEAVAIGIATPIKAMEDTIEYSASAYKTPPNAVVNDLLKRLPGVEVGSDGSIKAQGQSIKKILIDGEEFFSDDPAVASKNIPVAMVKTAQVINRKSDLARLTGVDDGEDEMVINLTVKEDMKKGWYGTVEGGYGTDNTYKGSFIANGMYGKNQFTILGNANNINDEGFTDNNGNRFRRFGGRSGINTTQSLGLNFNVGSQKLRVGGNVMYSHNDRENRSRSTRRNIFTDGDTHDNTQKSSRDRGHNIGADFRLKWEPDSFNTLDFRPHLSLNFNKSDSYSTNFNYGLTEADRIANSRNISASDGKSYELSGRLIYNHKFNHRRGRSFSLSGNYSFSNVHEDEEVWSRNAYWRPRLDQDIDSLYEDYQLIKNHTWNNRVNARVSWTEPLGDVANGNFIEFAYMMNYRWNNADKQVWHDPIIQVPIEDTSLKDYTFADWLNWTLADRIAGLTTDDLQWDGSNSNSFRNNYFNQQIRVGYKKVNKKYTLNIGVNVNPQMSRSTNLTNPDKTIPTRWVWNFSPFARLNYKFSKQTALNIFYNGRSSEPSLSQLQPVADTSDPMNVIQGNPSLKPSFAHNLFARFNTFDADRQQSFNAMAFAGFTQNGIAGNVTTDRLTGARLTTYENVNGNWNFGAFTMYSRPFRNKSWTFSNNLHFNFNQNVGFVNGELSKSATTRAGESFAIAFRPSNLELELRPRYDIQYATYSLQRNRNTTIHSYGGSFNGTWYTNFGLVLSTDLNYTANSGYAEGYNQNEWRWNASISYMFLRNQNATFAIKGYDLLNQTKSISRSETAQAVTDTQSLVLGRYVMATFTYKFTTFANGKTPKGNDDMFREGPPGSGHSRGGGRPPMGGPGGPGPR